MSATADVIVVGGGLVGLSTALYAAREGLDVVVMERAWPGRHASGANAGGVRSLNRHDAEIPLARAALDLWRRLEDLVGDDGGFVASGQVRVAEDDDQARTLRDRVARLHDLGYAHERWIEAGELHDRVGGIGRHCRGAIVVDDDGYADPQRTTAAFARAAVRAGVRLLVDTRVGGIGADGADLVVTTAGGRWTAPRVVNAAGGWGPCFAASIGEPVPVRATALQMLVTSPLGAFVRPVVGSQGRKLSLKQLANGRVVIGGAFEGTPDLETGTSRLDHAALAANARNALALFPEALRGASILRAWAGIEGWALDHLPIIDRSRTVGGLVHAFGFSGHGFALAPLIGRLVTDLLLERSSNLPLDPFRIDRFAGGGHAGG
ncbi:MAG: NAD(P)/FAD-dependent oxidoreductase [Pseudomonadota bacterium]